MIGKNVGEYRSESAIQVLAFVSLIGPFIPFKTYIVPVSLVYSFGFWGVYIHAQDCDLTLIEAFFRFLRYELLAVFAGYITQKYVFQAFMHNN